MSGVVVKRAPNPSGLILLVLLLLVPAGVLVMAHYEPLSPGWFHKHVLALLHDGVRSDREEVLVDGCVPFETQTQSRRADGTLIQTRQDFYAVRRVKRTITYGDRSQIEIIYSSKPYNNPQCP